MLSTTAQAARSAAPIVMPATRSAAATPADQRESQRTAETLKLIQDRLAPRRRVVHAGEAVYAAGERFASLYILNSGCFKMINLAADGREQVVSLKFRGDWLGFDGIAGAQYSCDAIAMDTGEVWMIRYDELLGASRDCPELLGVLHAAMSREIGRDRDSLMSLCTLPADARVAEFLRSWADSLSKSGLRCDQITLRLTRAEIGNYLGMTLETVSRALSKLSRCGVIAFAEKGRRELRIADVGALSAFVQGCLAPAAPTLQ